MEVDGDGGDDVLTVGPAEEVGQRTDKGGEAGDGVGDGALEHATALGRGEPVGKVGGGSMEPAAEGLEGTLEGGVFRGRPHRGVAVR